MTTDPSRPGIVVGVHGDDPSSRDAVALGVRLARMLEEDVLLSCVWVSAFGPLDPLGDETVRAEVEEELRALAAHVPDGIAARTELRTATSVQRGLRLAAQECDARVLVVGSHRPSESDTTAVGALPDAPCPVAVAPRGFRDAAEADGVVLAWDGSAEARIALTHAVDLAERTGGTLRIVAVFETGEDVDGRAWATGEATIRWLEGLRAEVRESLEEARELAGTGVAVEVDLREGLPAPQIVEAGHGAGLLVIGSRGYGALRRLVLGSTSVEVLRRAVVPVLVTPRGVEDADD